MNHTNFRLVQIKTKFFDNQVEKHITLSKNIMNSVRFSVQNYLVKKNESFRTETLGRK